LVCRLPNAHTGWMSNKIPQSPSAGGKWLKWAGFRGGTRMSYRVIRSLDVIGPVFQPEQASRGNPSRSGNKWRKKVNFLYSCIRSAQFNLNFSLLQSLISLVIFFSVCFSSSVNNFKWENHRFGLEWPRWFKINIILLYNKLWKEAENKNHF
jgi:hypothetical protein